LNPDEIGNALNQMFNSKVLSNLIMYVGWAFVIFTILIVFVAIYFWFQYKYKITYPVLLYDSDGNSAQVIKWKKDYARIVKKKDGTRKTHFLFQKKYTEPLKQEHIKPKNKVMMLRINDDLTYTPLPSFTLNEQGDPFKFESIKPESKEWAILELKETAQANATEDAQKRILNYTIAAIIIILVIVVFSIWLTLKYTGGVTEALNSVAPTLQNIASGLSGKVPN